MKKTGAMILLSLCCCVLFLGCTTRQVQPTPLGSYRAVSNVVLDGKRGDDEWKQVRRSAAISLTAGKNSYNRHYLWCMHDTEALYLMVQTFYHPKFETKRALVHGGEPLDTFHVQILSDDKRVLDILIASDGVAYAQDLSCAARQPYVSVPPETGIEVAVVVDEDPRRSKDKMLWFSEIKIPLSLLEVVGHRVYALISGTRCRIFFDPETRSINWCPNAP
jgi:hypothetical protein